MNICTRVGLAAFFRAQRGSAGVNSILLFAFSADGTERRGGGERWKGGLKRMKTQSKVKTMDFGHLLFGAG